MFRRLPWILLFIPAVSTARDPPVVSVKEALSRGQSVFIGRVVALTELKRSPPYIIHAEATVVVSRCLRGALCKARTLRIRHYPEVADDGLPVNLGFGAQYLFVLQTAEAKKGTFEFRSGVTPESGDGDLAWEIEGRLLPDFSADSEPGGFVSMWGPAGGPKEEIGFAELVGWVNERSPRK